MIKFSDIKLDQSFSFEHIILQSDVDSFAALSGDFNPLHVDEDFAINTGFRRPVVHGIFTASLVSRLVGMHLPGPGALWVSQNFDFKGPAFVGDNLLISAKVIRVSHSVKIATMQMKVTNQKNELILEGQGKVTVLELQKLGVEKQNMKNKCLVIGGAKGIGASVVREMMDRGDEIVLTYSQSKEAANELVKLNQNNANACSAVKCDLLVDEDIEALIQRLKNSDFTPNVIVYCAAMLPQPTPFPDVSWEAFNGFFEVQIKGAFKLVQALIGEMRSDAFNSIVFVSSLYAEGTPPAQQVAYVTSKAALNGFMRALSIEYGPKNVNVNCVAPGMTNTDMIANIPQKVKLTTKMNTPLRRLAETEDIAKTITFLASPEAKHITGTVLNITGGAR